LIIDYLLQRELKPGDKLPIEVELSEQLGVARNSLRETTKMLTSLGVFEIKRGVGTFIPKSISGFIFNPLILTLVFRQSTSEELAELRYLFEVGMVDLILEGITEEDTEKLKLINEDIRIVEKKTPSNARQLRESTLIFTDR
jgi:GntR family transcriptional repressor for pyruvate dehydrogenase complex